MISVLVLGLLRAAARVHEQVALTHAATRSAVVRPAVRAEPSPALPGQAVTFYPPHGALRVRAIGGGFGAGLDDDGDGPLTSAVWKPTNYKFKVWMPAAKGSAQQARMVESALTVGVSAGRFPPLATYWDWRHWKIDVPDGWSRYASGGQDPAQSALIYFERDEDSPERVAVAMLPAGAMTSDELARKVKDELPTQYDVLKSVAMWPTSYGGDAADWLAFQGIDRAQPDVLTQSDVLVFVHGGRGYVISARTPASRYAEQAPLMRALVRSFGFDPPGSQAAEVAAKAAATARVAAALAAAAKSAAAKAASAHSASAGHERADPRRQARGAERGAPGAVAR